MLINLPLAQWVYSWLGPTPSSQLYYYIHKGLLHHLRMLLVTLKYLVQASARK